MKFSGLITLALTALSATTYGTPIVSSNATLLLEPRSIHTTHHRLYQDRPQAATPTTVTADILSNMKLFAQYAAAAYCNSDEDLVGSAVTCSDNVCDSVSATNYAYLGYDQSEAQGFIAIDSTRSLIVVPYAGSDNFDNYIADLLIPKEDCEVDLVDGGKLHTGFQDAWEDVESTTMQGLKAAVAAYPSYSVVITGHSLGGAVATIGAAYIRAAGIPCDIYSYGSPRVGNEEFVNFLDSQAGAHYRVTDTNDPIGRYPGKIFGFRHTYPEFWLSTGSATTVDYTIGDIVVCEGIANTDCNDGTSSLSTTAHSYYFEKIGGCK